jgi:hypothetical protein
LKVHDPAISSQLRAEMPCPRRGALGSSMPRTEIGGALPIARKKLTHMDGPRLLPLERKVEQLRKIEPVLKDLYHELLDQDPKDEAEAVLVALVRVRAALAAEEERLDAAR